MKLPLRYLQVTLVLVAFAASRPVSRAQEWNPGTARKWQGAQSAFGAGEFAKATSLLEEIVRSSAVTTPWLEKGVVAAANGKQQWLESVVYLLGASHFNGKQWDAAIFVFGRYRELFPQSPRFDQVSFSLAQACQWADRPADAIAVATTLLPKPLFHARAVLLLAELYRRTNNTAAVVALLEKERAVPNLNPFYAQRIAALLFPHYLASARDSEAKSLLSEMDADIDHLPDIAAFNTMAILLGDFFLTRKQTGEALICYRKVRDNAGMVTQQKGKIRALRRDLAANLLRVQGDPLNSALIQQENKDLAVEIAAAEKALGQYQDLPPVMPPLLLRVAQAYTMEGSTWQAAVVYSELMRRYPAATEAEEALYGSIVLFQQLKQTARALELCAAYLEHHAKGKYADSVAYLRGIMAYEQEDFEAATRYLSEYVRTQPDGARKQQTEILLGDIGLRQQKFDEAAAQYTAFGERYPQSVYAEKAVYHRALAKLFGGHTDEAGPALRGYLEKYPKGLYIADAEYRLALLKYQDGKAELVLVDCANWQKKFGKQGPFAEVLALAGDALASLNRDGEAIDSYVAASAVARNNEVLNYSLFAAAKLLQKQRKWEEIARLFEDFVKKNPGHPTVVAAISWTGRALSKLGRDEEARQLMAETARQFINDPLREAVDEILLQLAQLSARKRPQAVVMPTAGPSGSPAAPPIPEAASPVSNDEENIARMLEIPDLSEKPTARARILFAEAALAHVQRHPEKEKELLLKIGRDFQPDDLSAALLGRVGDSFVEANQFDRAQVFYDRLMEEYRKSPLVEYACNGLGRIAYQKGDFAKAERLYRNALDQGLASVKQQEITLGEARALLALGKPEEARGYFEQVASNRAWRGESTAFSVFSLGDIQMQEGKLPEANAFYQRVFVSYAKYPSVQAKAYLKSGEVFEKMGKKTEAINTYTEMLKNSNLAAFPETASARERLQALSTP